MRLDVEQEGHLTKQNRQGSCALPHTTCRQPRVKTPALRSLNAISSYFSHKHFLVHQLRISLRLVGTVSLGMTRPEATTATPTASRPSRSRVRSAPSESLERWLSDPSDTAHGRGRRSWRIGGGGDGWSCRPLGMHINPEGCGCHVIVAGREGRRCQRCAHCNVGRMP